MQTNDGCIPSKIWEDILTRLNVKTLTRCKCVCKEWFNLISSPYFQDLHCLRSQHNLHLLSRSILSYHNHLGFTCQFFSMDMNPGASIHTKFTALVDGPIRLILPSCWGLVCLATQTRIYIYNPATLGLVALPPSPNPNSTMCGFGFGYILSSKCYKVVRFVYGKSTQRIECSVLQLGRGAKSSELSWRVLEQACPYFVEEFSLPAFAQETIYWNISRNQARRRDNDDILAFNIEKDEFSVIPHPSEWRYTPHNWMQLVNLDGRLFLLQISPSHIAIWVRRDHQWYRGGRLIDVKGIDRTHVGQIMYIKDGELIFASLRNHLLLYNIKKTSFKRLHFPFMVYGLAIYWETLFPLGDSHY